ncbi:armadillo repeat-containing kinesin-like protein 2 [Artemisia annua]|uniref:Armadillo repeat-containing kinesin-like protein 2 n=1 Tax=Artemisia annua TaxID=35608 RepID=A0A2U1LI40_ARTAN|nr:armadillo repeat-containing kinesin-like protein 2 [Artemisia annua]
MFVVPFSGRVRVAVRLRPRNAEETVTYADFADCVELQPETVGAQIPMNLMSCSRNLHPRSEFMKLLRNLWWRLKSLPATLLKKLLPAIDSGPPCHRTSNGNVSRGMLFSFIVSAFLHTDVDKNMIAS